MEEDAGVKAPVTRLRRRLSVEQTEENKSPAVNTPTKRRGRKKPELELIDENTPENTTTRRTKKTAIKDVIDPVEDKPITPSRRSTRIKSNTSIVSETAVAVGSPRAKRATRRASHVESDNETPVTPARVTRRTRKDSASSIDKVEQPTVKPPIQITEVIAEEPEITSRKSTNSAIMSEQNKLPDGSRRSPRLMKKLNQSIDKTEEVVSDQSNSSQDKIEVPEKQTVDLNGPEIDEDINEAQITQKDRLSISSSNLIKDLDTKVKSKKNKLNLNKSTTLVELQNDAKTKRNRTKSWTTVSEANENVFSSDNESAKNKIKSPSLFNHSVSEDIQNISLDQNKSKKNKSSNSFVVENINQSLNVENNKSIDVNAMESDIQNQSKLKVGNENDNGNTSSLFEKEPSGDIKTLVVIEDSDSNSAKANVQDTSDSGDQCVPVVKNPETLEINQFNLLPDIILNKSKNRTITDNSCEPMDVDETIPDSLVIAETETIEQNSNKISLIGDEKEVNVSNNQNSNNSKSKLSLSSNLESINENKSTLILSHLKDTPVGSPKIVNKLLSKSAIDLDVTQENDTNKKNSSLNYLTSTPLQQKTFQKLVMQVNTSIIASNNDNKHEIDNVENTPKRQETSDLLNKCDLSDNKNKSMSKVMDDKVDVSAVNESIKESFKEQQKKISLAIEQTNEKINENEESDEDIPIKKSNKAKSKRSKAINKISSISSNDSDEESELSDNESRESNILDNEAEDMGNDYESGDSQDESERQYEKENEVLEKGETLTSENDLSNDSDYEKDSFIVSSDEEDNELLEGTEDDLSMSDNELKMTSKSKKKYDERKLKEQKMASREMYESRHNIKQKSEKIKKNNRQKLSSSESESSESEKKSQKPKKNNRMRLDSSHEASFVESEKKNISKIKTPRLSESVCDDVANEKEITIINDSIKEKDPLSQIKEEPKTPIKSANSTIAFIDSEDTINDKNESTKTQTELMDPLEDSMDDDDGSLCSENQDIMQDYDSILNDLNKSNKIKTKTCDISLNLDKKSKKKAKTAIVDELNLTQVKSTKKAKNKPVTEIKALKDEKISKDSGESSDSIDIHLLFSEDSNNSDDVKNKKEEANTEDKFIPLKRTEAKSNILEDEESNLSLSRSAKKNKKRISQIDKITSSDTTEDNNLSFFIDTEGTHSDTINKSHNKSLKNNLSINNINEDDSDSNETPTQEELSIHKQKTQIIDETDSSTNKSLNKSVTRTPGSTKKKGTPKPPKESVVASNSDSDAPMEVSYQKERRVSKIQDHLDVEKDETDFVPNKSLNKSLLKTPLSERKKKTNRNDLEDTKNPNISANISLIKTPNSGRKTLDQDIEEIENEDNVTFIEKSFNKSIVKTPASEKKKKKKKSLSLLNDEETGDVVSTEVVLNNSIDIKNKKKSISENKSLCEESNEEVSNINLIKTPNSGKKNKLSESHSEDKNDLNPNLSFSKSMTRTPNTKVNKKISITHVDQSEEGSVEPVLNVSKIKTPGSQKKHVPEKEEDPETINKNSKKRKRKSSGHNAVEETVAEDGQVRLLNESLVNNQEKKRKISQQETTEKVTKETDKNKNQIIGNNELVQSVDIPKIQKSKKRKERDEDDENIVSKVSKQNSYEKAPVSRLPTSLLKQLDDKPQPKNQQPKAKKQKVISTTQFIVEEAKIRKTKPSNYLEESVYLNDDDDECKRKKPKGRILNPKVLPFVPTASISNSGYTTNFKVNIVPKETKFVAQSNSIGNFKDDYLYNKKIKRQGTYELYKRNRNLKISKF